MRSFKIALLLSAGFATSAFVYACSDNSTPSTPVVPDSGVQLTDGGGIPADSGPGTVPDCETACQLAMTNCTVPVLTLGDGGTQQYLSVQGCINTCKTMPLGDFGATSGDTVGCRQYHAGSPAVSDPELHCQHIGITGNNVCMSPGLAGRCEAFCRATTSLCTDARLGAGKAPYADKAACNTACLAFDFKTDLPELRNSGNTLNCRLYHTMLAFNDLDAGPAAECPNTAAVSPACK